jgi:ArsR family transcriptional regulator
MSDPLSVFPELGDPTRLRVLIAILAGRKNVSSIVSELKLSQPQVSYHLRKLKDAGLATEEKDGRWVWYQAGSATDDPHVRDLLTVLARWAGIVVPGAGIGVTCDDATCGRGVTLGRGGGGGGGGRRRSPVPRPVREREDDVEEDRPVVERPVKKPDDLDDFLL